VPAEVVWASIVRPSAPSVICTLRGFADSATGIRSVSSPVFVAGHEALRVERLAEEQLAGKRAVQALGGDHLVALRVGQPAHPGT
jgi:hypothetical protein